MPLRISFGIVLLTLLLQGGSATLVVGKTLGTRTPPADGASPREGGGQ